MKTQEIVSDLIERAKEIAKRETQHFPEAASVGDRARQGDIYITLLSRVPIGAKKENVIQLQLAPGTTQGSRHILDSDKGVTAYTLASPTEFDGPVLKLAEDRTVTHPEHGDFILPPGIYAISYQRNVDQMERARRVRD